MSEELTTRVETNGVTRIYKRSRGRFGNGETAGHIRDLIRDSVKTDNALADFVVQYILVPNKLNSHSDQKKIIQAIHSWINKNVMYVSDGVNLERLKSPRETLKPETPYGDCDDLVTLEASMLGAIGIPTSLVLASYKEDTDGFDHIFLIAHLKDGQTIPLEPTIKEVKQIGFYVKPILDYKIEPVFPSDWKELNPTRIARGVARGAARLTGAVEPLLGFVFPELATAASVGQVGKKINDFVLQRG